MDEVLTELDKSGTWELAHAFAFFVAGLVSWDFVQQRMLQVEALVHWRIDCTKSEATYPIGTFLKSRG